MTYIAYYRVSTDKQGVAGLGMDAQQSAVRSFALPLAEYTEVESGKRKDRPELLAALAHCRSTGATLVIAKLDRLARNVAFVSSLMESGVEFVALDMPTANKLMIHIMAAFAEHEAAMISIRTKAALAIAKKPVVEGGRGIKLGGYRGPIARADEGREQSRKMRLALSLKRVNDIRPIIINIKASGHTTLRAIADEMNKRGVPAPRGGAWSATQVRRIAA